MTFKLLPKWGNFDKSGHTDIGVPKFVSFGLKACSGKLVIFTHPYFLFPLGLPKYFYPLPTTYSSLVNNKCLRKRQS